MNILAIDTSNATLGVAVVNEEKVLGEYITNVKRDHSVRVMPAIDCLLRDCGLKPYDITKVVVAKGPGSYTGVRIGVTIAKTLAWTLNIPLVGISSLEILASQVGRYFDGYVSPLFDARRGQIYTGLYGYGDGELRTIVNDQIILSKDWAALLKKDYPDSKEILFVGNDLPLHQSNFEDILGEKAVFAHMTEHNPRPGELAYLGMDKSGEEIHSFTPNYIRLAEAEAKWLEAHKKNEKRAE